MKKRAVFNQTGEGVGWARWTWNPVTGCLQGCPYCYARDLAGRRKAQGTGFKVINGREDHSDDPFEPKFWPERLEAPFKTALPRPWTGNIWDRSVFVCSMGDLFGEWVPQDWIDAVRDVKASWAAKQTQKAVEPEKPAIIHRESIGTPCGFIIKGKTGDRCKMPCEHYRSICLTEAIRDGWPGFLKKSGAV